MFVKIYEEFWNARHDPFGQCVCGESAAEKNGDWTVVVVTNKLTQMKLTNS